MTLPLRADEIRGKTMRWTWTEGPTKGMTHEHVFHEDGTVTWRSIDGSKREEGGPAKERAEYGAIRVEEDIYAVSYLAPSGYTLTVVLNFRNFKMAGFASGAKEWYPVQGVFEVVE